MKPRVEKYDRFKLGLNFIKRENLASKNTRWLEMKKQVVLSKHNRLALKEILQEQFKIWEGDGLTT